MFEVQVQGRFKKVPKGAVYVGADAENKLELGLLTRSFCRVILQFVMTMVRNLHYSFGETAKGDDYEISHIVAPLFSTMDKIVVTPEGQKPPPMGTPFPEDLEFRKKRLDPVQVENIHIDTSSTYSFSVNTSNMDLCSWTLVNVPMLREMNLNTFSGGCPVRLVSYEVPPPKSGESKYECPHPHKKLNYVFNLKITSVDTDKGVELELDVDDSDADADEEEEEEDLNLAGFSGGGSGEDPMMEDDLMTEEEEEDLLEEAEGDEDDEEDGENPRSPWRKRVRGLSG